MIEIHYANEKKHGRINKILRNVYNDQINFSFEWFLFLFPKFETSYFANVTQIEKYKNVIKV